MSRTRDFNKRSKNLINQQHFVECFFNVLPLFQVEPSLNLLSVVLSETKIDRLEILTLATSYQNSWGIT